MRLCRKARLDDRYLTFAPGGFHVGKRSFKMSYAQLHELIVQLRELFASSRSKATAKKKITWCRWA